MKYQTAECARRLSGLSGRLACLPAALSFRRRKFSSPSVLRGVGLLVLLFSLTPLLQNVNAQPAGTQPIPGLPLTGGSGGSRFRAICPAGTLLTGLALRTGDDVDAVQPLCLGSDGSRKLDTPWYGGDGGKLKVLLCSSSTPALVGLDVGAEGKRTFIVNNLHIYCSESGPNPTALDYPSAVFDGPTAKGAGPFGESFGNAPVKEHQACPAGQVAIGIHGRSGVWLDAIGLVCGPAPRARAGAPAGGADGPQRVTSVGKKSTGVRSGPPVTSVGKRSTGVRSGPPIPICERARDARARNSPVAPNLEAQCRALGGDPNAPAADAGAANAPPAEAVASAAAIGDEAAAAGDAMVNNDPLASELRRYYSPATRRGFNIGIAVMEGRTEFGADLQPILNILSPEEQDGFKTAVSFAQDRNRNADLSRVGAAIAEKDAQLDEARRTGGSQSARRRIQDARAWLGFDIATGIFGDPAQGALGYTEPTGESQEIRDRLGPHAQLGFDASQRMHLSRRNQGTSDTAVPTDSDFPTRVEGRGGRRRPTDETGPTERPGGRRRPPNESGPRERPRSRGYGDTAQPPDNTAAAEVSSEPAGADIYVDGTFSGSTPSKLQLAVGEHTIKVTRRGYKDWERKVTIEAGSAKTLHAILEPTAGSQ